MAKRAVCVGINNYPGTDSDLNGCVNDARDWSAELQTRGFQVVQLLDSSATKAAIVSALNQGLEQSKFGDCFVFTYSGHGTWLPDRDGDEPDERDEALCPHDIEAGPLVDDELYEVFGARPHGVRLIMISDSCHSGTVARLARSDGSRPRVRYLAPEVYISDPDELRQMRYLERTLSRGRSRGTALLLAGCKDTEYSWDADFQGRPNGAFTRVALDCLRRLPPTAHYGQWLAEIRKHLPSASYPQTPKLVATSHQRRWEVLS